MSSLLFLLEFVLFHVLQYTTNYLEAMLIISFALLGIGLGGLLNNVIPWTEDQLFIFCFLGSWVFLLLTVVKIILWPSLGMMNFMATVLFLFPGLYLARMFTLQDSHRVYWVDLLAAATSVIFLTIAYMLLSSEFIILIILILLSIGGLITACRMKHSRKVWVSLFTFLFIISDSFFLWHYKTHDFDLFNLSKRGSNLNPNKSFANDLRLIKSYDNLISRIEILNFSKYPRRFFVSFSGYINDGFMNIPEFFKERLVYGLIEKPHIYIIGASAQGIVKIAQGMTPSSNIDGIEINPSIYQIMTKDFAMESSFPYEGTNIKVGNAIADLKSRKTSYDVITMMNIHSMPRISYLGPPDFLHTREFYKTVFNHLSPRGYLMLEERPWKQQGKYAFYRLIITLYLTLKELGVPDPQANFFIYSFRLPIAPYTSHQNLKESSFVGMMVQKASLSASDILKIKQWAISQRYFTSIDYLNGMDKSGLYRQLFTSIKNHQLATDYPGWDLSELSNDRPFPAAGGDNFRQLRFFFFRALCFALFFLFLTGFFSSFHQSLFFMNFRFLLFHITIGMAYMMVETLFMNIYQKEFISPSFAFIFTLTPLLAASAFGGSLLNKLCKPWVMATAVIISLILHWLLIFPFADMFVLTFRIILIIMLMTLSGFFMGYFFPFGLTKAKENGLGKNVAFYFACNCIAGAFAVVFSYFLSVHFGFSIMFLICGFLYMIAPLLLP